ncbi:hypothetical protein [Streptomyces sp. UG1]|uniref:hypothetical protein n=1 Tax=Streptomyces sp. UG1 TaxID=3417652 RepID=UPI003CF373CA
MDELVERVDDHDRVLGVVPHWLGVHEAVVPDSVAADPDEVARHGRLTEPVPRGPGGAVLTLPASRAEAPACGRRAL